MAQRLCEETFPAPRELKVLWIANLSAASARFAYQMVSNCWEGKKVEKEKKRQLQSGHIPQDKSQTVSVLIKQNKNKKRASSLYNGVSFQSASGSTPLLCAVADDGRDYNNER